MIIRTKIVATVGPASGDEAMIRRLAEAGCDVFRINFSHGSDEQRDRFLGAIRQVESERGRPVAVMADLCGPKIRVGMIEGGSILLADGQELTICREPVEGNAERISTTLAELVDEIQPGERILLDDGKLTLEATGRCDHDAVTVKVVRGGMLASGKGVNLPHTNLSLSALTEKDRRDAAWIADRAFDYVALSFVRSADDVNTLRDLLESHGCRAHIVSKIEKPQAVAHIEEILDATDAVMVARGDLGVEMDLPQVPVVQKRIARLAQQAGKPCIIATQMLETMTRSTTPTRAEVSDVANAVLDHTDAVMLSGETAVGEHPAAAVEMMNDIVANVQAFDDETPCAIDVVHTAAPTTAALAAAISRIIQRESITAVAAFTGTGATVRMLSKNRLPCPILGLSSDEAAVRRMALYYGVSARLISPVPEHTRDVLAQAEQFARELGLAGQGDRVVVLSGRPIGAPNATNTLVVHTVGPASG